MKLINLKLENFTCFLEEVELKFGDGLNIVNADNGFGKSKFLDSINWVISDKIFQGDEWIDSKDVNLYPLWYTNPENDLHYKIDEIISSVVLEFEAPDIENNIENDTTWVFTKKRFHVRNEDHSIRQNRDVLEIKYMDIETGEHKILGSYREHDVIETLFPSAIRNFMWFQGEAFKDISLSHDSETFNKVLDTISHYPIYGKMVERAKLAHSKKDSSINRLRREQIGITTEQQNKLHRKDVLIKKIPEIENHIEEIENDISECKTHIDEYDLYLRNSVDYVKLDRKIKEKEASIKHINESIEQYEFSKVNLLIKKWIIVGSKKHINNFQKNIDNLQEELNQIDETKIPLHIPGPDLVQGMIDDMKCHICDRDIDSKEDDSYKALLKRLEVFKEGKKAKWLRKNFDDFKRIRRNALESYSEIEHSINSHSKSIKTKIRERNKFLRDKEGLENELKQLSGGNVGENNGSNYDMFFIKKQAKDKELASLNLKLGQKSRELNDKKTEKNNLTQEISSFETDNNDIKIGEKSLLYYSTILEALEQLENEAKTNLENEITLKSNELFSVYYDNPGVNIEITNGNVRLTDKTTKDEASFGIFNKSQQEMIKFSVINSLLKLSNEKLGNALPLIADAPTSSSSWTNTRYFTDNVGNNFEQVVLFSKDYIEKSKDNSIKTELVELCLNGGGAWYWVQKIDKDGNPVGRQFGNPKSDSESKTIIVEKLISDKTK